MPSASILYSTLNIQISKIIHHHWTRPFLTKSKLKSSSNQKSPTNTINNENMPNAGFKDGVPSASILYSTLNTQISKIIHHHWTRPFHTTVNLKSSSNQKSPTKTINNENIPRWVRKSSILEALSNCYYLNIHWCSGLKDYMPSEGHKKRR